ncbi:hypothetical protein, partial [Pseudomonas aeruginosa]|uniref:hypothetical protein n=1 Tax=Pseudomonas aeruginosa TaxID=287 RepID=UPI001F3BD81A
IDKYPPLVARLERAPGTKEPRYGHLLGGEISAQRLDLGLMQRIAARLPLGEAPRQWLAELAPQGLVSELKASWEGAPQAP